MGPFTLDLNLETPRLPAANDLFASRDTIPASDSLYAVETTLAGATTETLEPNVSPGRQTLWWRLRPQTDGGLYLTAESLGFTTELRVYQGDQLSNLIPLSPSPLHAGYDVQAGVDYAIQLSGEDPFTGNFRFTAELISRAHDSFSDRAMAEGPEFLFTTDLRPMRSEFAEILPGSTNTAWVSWTARSKGASGAHSLELGAIF